MTVREWLGSHYSVQAKFRVVPNGTEFNYARVSSTGKSALIGWLRPGSTAPSGLLTTRYVPLDSTIFPVPETEG